MIHTRFYKNSFVFFLVLVFLFGLMAPMALADPDDDAAGEMEENAVLTNAADDILPVELVSPSAVVIELSSNTTLLSHDPHYQVNPGSIAKIAALYVLCSECFKGGADLKDRVVITSDVLMGGSGVIPLKVDEELSFEDLLYLMYMDYSDTAAYAAAVHAMGSADNLVTAMNAFAEACQCKDTVFTNITGAYDEAMRVSPADIVLMLNRAMQNTLFMEVFSARSYTVHDTNKSIGRSLITSNQLQRSGSDYYRPNCIGGRFAGLSDGYTTISLSKNSETEMELLVIVSGAVTSEDNYSDTIRLIDWVVNNYEWRTLCRSGETLASVSVAMGRGTDHVNLGPEKDVNAMLDMDIDLEDFEQQILLYDETELVAPLEKGTVLGEVHFIYAGKDYASVHLVANSPVELNTFSYLKNEVTSTLESSGVMKLLKIVGILLACYLFYAVVHWLLRLIKKIRYAAAKRKLKKERIEGTHPYDPTMVNTNTRRMIPMPVLSDSGRIITVAKENDPEEDNFVIVPIPEDFVLEGEDGNETPEEKISPEESGNTSEMTDEDKTAEDSPIGEITGSAGLPELFMEDILADEAANGAEQILSENMDITERNTENE